MRGLRVVCVVLAGICLLGLFSKEASDTDFWWHLKTGQYLLEQKQPPDPDPFAFTTALKPPATAGEAQVRRFNLTHEWLAQIPMYLFYRAGGIAAVVFARAALLAAMCGLVGWLAWRRSGNEYAGIAAAFASSSVAAIFAADRPALVTFFFVSLFLAILDQRKYLWALPPLLLLWANMHGGFFLGWLILAAYSVDAWFTKDKDRKRLWMISAIAVLGSGLNPNGFNVIGTLLLYRQSALTSTLIEWQRPYLWGPPYAFDILLYSAAAVLVVSWKKVRWADWILFIAFAAAALLAFRNIILIAIFSPVLVAAYWTWPLKIPRVIYQWATPVVLLIGLGWGISQGSFFEFRSAAWALPDGAANYLRDHRPAGPIFNTYEYGGYLIWRLAPQSKVFIDGRSLSETVYSDYRKILYNENAPPMQLSGPRAQLLDQYSVQTVVMNGLEYVTGYSYPLAFALGNPASTDWQLVYDDAHALIFQKNPPPGTQVYPNKALRVVNHMDAECAAHIEHAPEQPMCARQLADLWLRTGDPARAKKMLGIYLAHISGDRAAEQKFLELSR